MKKCLALFCPTARRLALSSLVLAFASVGVCASDDSSVFQSPSRETKRIGVGIGVGDPAPSLLGLKGYYNLTNFVRAEIGYAEAEATTSVEVNRTGVVAKTTKAATYGVGAAGFVPGWELSPMVGLHYSYLNVSGPEDTEFPFLGKTGSDVYSTLGVDWQLAGGLQVGAGYSISLLAGRESRFFANLGWFF